MKSGSIICWGVVFTLVLAISSCAGGGRTGPVAAVAAARHWTAAQEYLDRGMIRHARREARVVLRLDPGHAGARRLLKVRARARAGKGDAALDATVEPGMLLREARRAYRESRLVDAARMANELLLVDPGASGATRILRDMEREEYQPSPLGVNDVLRGMFEEGMGYYRTGSWSAAAKVFQRAHAISPSHEQIWKYFNLCRARAEESNVVVGLRRAREAVSLGKDDEARELLHKVLEVEPENAEAIEMLVALGENMKDAELLARAKRHFNRGVEAYEQGRWVDAVREWETVISLTPDDDEARTLLKRAKGRLAEEKRVARKRVPGMHRRARTLYQQGKLDEAARMYRDILEINPDDDKANRSVALIDEKLAEE